MLRRGKELNFPNVFKFFPVDNMRRFFLGGGASGIEV